MNKMNSSDTGAVILVGSILQGLILRGYYNS